MPFFARKLQYGDRNLRQKSPTFWPGLELDNTGREKETSIFVLVVRQRYNILQVGPETLSLKEYPPGILQNRLGTGLSVSSATFLPI